MYFDKEFALFTWEWLPATEDMFDDEAKEILTAMMTAIENSKPKYVLANDVQNLGSFSVDIQDWIGQTVAKTFIDCKIKRIALILSNEFISQMPIGQAQDEVNAKSEGKFVMKAFVDKDMELAKEWLFENID